MKEKDTYVHRVEMKEPVSDNFTEKSASSRFDFVKHVITWRAVIVLLIHMSFVVNIIPKIGLSMALVCMVRIRSPSVDNLNTTNVSWVDGNQTDKQVNKFTYFK